MAALIQSILQTWKRMLASFHKMKQRYEPIFWTLHSLGTQLFCDRVKFLKPTF